MRIYLLPVGNEFDFDEQGFNEAVGGYEPNKGPLASLLLPHGALLILGGLVLVDRFSSMYPYAAELGRSLERPEDDEAVSRMRFENATHDRLEGVDIAVGDREVFTELGETRRQ